MDELLRVAMLGTSRQKQPTLQTQDELAAWAAAVAAGSLERRLLLEAGARYVYSVAGHAAHLPDTPCAPAPPETLAPCPQQAAMLLEQLLTGDTAEEVLQEAFSALAHRGWCIPPALLPRVLSMEKPSLRAAARPALGERGRWLAGFRPEWHWVLAEPQMPSPQEAQRLWQEGTLPERCRVLETLRQHHPALSRELLAESWSSEKADARLRLLTAFSRQVLPEDEPFLEQALADRGKEVRSLAADLLVRLPGSRYTQWVWQVAKEMVRYAHPSAETRAPQNRPPSTSGKEPAAGQLQLALPAAFDPAWAGRGLVEQPPRGVGKREYWFWQIVRRVPPPHWQGHFQAAPAALAAAAAQAEEAQALLAAWSDAAIAQHATEWYGPLWDAWLECPAPPEQSFWAEARSRFMRHAAASRALPEAAARLRRLLSLSDTLYCELLECLPWPWEREISGDVLSDITERVAGAVRGQYWEYSSWFEALTLAARRMHPCNLEDALAWADSIEAGDGLAQHASFLTFCEVVRLRREVARRLSP